MTEEKFVGAGKGLAAKFGKVMQDERGPKVSRVTKSSLVVLDIVIGAPVAVFIDTVPLLVVLATITLPAPINAVVLVLLEILVLIARS